MPDHSQVARFAPAGRAKPGRRISIARTNISVDKTVFEEFAAEAERKKMTLFAFANRSLSAITDISREGGSPDEFYRIWRMLSLLRQVDAIALPSDLVEYLVEKQYTSDSASTLARFRRLGTSLVGLLKMAAEGIEDIAPLAKDFGFFIPIKHFALTKREDGAIQIDVVGAGRAIETTVCSSEFLKAVVTGYGYEVKTEELHPGTIRLMAQKP